MCYDDQAQPPVPPGSAGAAHGEDVVVAGSDGNRFAAYVARRTNRNWPRSSSSPMCAACTNSTRHAIVSGRHARSGPGRRDRLLRRYVARFWRWRQLARSRIADALPSARALRRRRPGHPGRAGRHLRPAAG